MAMVVAVHGGLRVSELASLTFEDLTMDGNCFTFFIRESKTDQSGVGHQFTVTSSAVESVCPCALIREYIELFNEKCGRFLRRIGPDGRPTKSPVGVNKLGSYPKIVADFLGLEGDFSGHTFRRSSATIMADGGATTLQLKRHGRWRSSTVAEDYVGSSKLARRQGSEIINGAAGSVIGYGEMSRSRNVATCEKVGGCQFENCNVTLNFYGHS